MAKVFFYVQNEQHGIPKFVEQAPKWKFSNLFDHSVILPKFTQNFLQFQNEQNQYPYLRKASFRSRRLRSLFFISSLVQKKFLEAL